ncbi:hypothetical protein BGZ68_002924, partial [Mortierella alpina]
MDLVKEFLGSDGQVLLILGDSGAGKSTFNRHLENELWREYAVGDPVPLFINLPAVAENYRDIIGEQLRIHALSDVKIKELKQHRQMVLICDGYDETQLKINLHTANKFNQEGQENIKMIISCRSTYLGQDYRIQFEPQQNDRYAGTAKGLYTEAVIVPFSSAQIEDYVNQFVRDPEVHKLMGVGRIWSTEDYMSTLKSIPNMMDLVKNPFLLSLSLRALPLVVKDEDDLSKVKVTRLTLYNSFTDQWLDTNKRRLANMTKSAETNVGKELSVIDFLAEHVQSDEDFKQQLHQIIEFSKTDTTASQAAANAITILVRAGVNFNGADLRGIQIPGADLSRGQFDSAQLQGANLSGTTLRRIWLRQADLSDAQMADVQFGEWPFLKEESKVRSCAYSPDGKIFAAGLMNGSISLYKTATWENIHILKGHTGSVMSVVFSPNSQQIASGSDDKTVQLWDAQTGAPGVVLSDHTKTVWSVVFSPNGQQIASGSDDETVRLWDAQTGAPGLILTGHAGGINCVVFSPSGHQIASGSDDTTVRLWDGQTGAPGAVLSGHTKRVWSVVFSPGGQQIASGSYDGTVRLWDAQTGAPGAVLSGHTQPVWSVAFAPSGHQIASGSEDKTVRLWDAETGAPGAVLSGHTQTVWSVVFSPSGQQIASGSDDMT